MTSPSLERNPNLDTWLEIRSDGYISLYPGKVEFGQGIRTALALIAAEELDVDVGRIRVEPVDSARSANEIYTSGSGSMEQSGSAVRQATAHARHLMLQLAAEQLGVAVDRLAVEDGEIRAPGSNRWTTYWQLMGGKTFGCQVSSEVTPKSAAQYRQIGKQRVQPKELTAIVTGQAYFVHDLELPDMVHGRVVRPPHYHARLVSVDVAAVKAATDAGANAAGRLKLSITGKHLDISSLRHGVGHGGVDHVCHLQQFAIT